MKIIYIFLTIFSLISLGSCSDYLTTEMPSTQTPENITKTNAGTKQLIGALYAKYSQANQERLVNFGNGNDVETTDKPYSKGTDQSLYNFLQDIGNIPESHIGNDTYDRLYALIAIANDAIGAIEAQPRFIDATLTPKDKPSEFGQLYGEALVMRANAYYELVRWWGNVPFQYGPLKAGDAVFLGKTDRNVILDKMIEDLKKAEPMMYWGGSDPGLSGMEKYLRASRGYACGLLGKIALTRGGYYMAISGKEMVRATDWANYYSLARTYLKKIHDSGAYGYAPDFYNYFKNLMCQIVDIQETIFAQQAYATGSGTAGYNPARFVIGGGKDVGKAYAAIRHNLYYYYSFDSTDVRLKRTVTAIGLDGNKAGSSTGNKAGPYNDRFNEVLAPPLYVASGLDKAGLCNNKFDKSESTVDAVRMSSGAYSTGVNMPVMRYSDAMLMLAEAEIELGGTHSMDMGLVSEIFTAVRNRAFKGNPNKTTKVDSYIAFLGSDKQKWFNALVNERAWEFGGEWMRKPDLIRWNLFGAKITESRNGLKAMDAGAKAAGFYSLVRDFGNYQLTYKVPQKVYFMYDTIVSGKGYGNIKLIGTHNALLTPPADQRGMKFTASYWLGVDETKNVNGGFDQPPYGSMKFVLDNIWIGYTDGGTPPNYIIPIAHANILASGGALMNDYGWSQ